jgi:hypothetical protein
MAALEAHWRRDPDIRFGQLVMNLSRDHRGQFRDVWEWDDQEFLRAIERDALRTEAT